MRCIDADHLIGLVKDATILGDGFKQAFIAIVRTSVPAAVVL